MSWLPTLLTATPEIRQQPRQPDNGPSRGRHEFPDGRGCEQLVAHLMPAAAAAQFAFSPNARAPSFSFQNASRASTSVAVMSGDATSSTLTP